MRSTPAADRNAQASRPGKLSAAERSSLNEALAKALAFRDAGKMPEAREWTEELVKLLKSHDLLAASARSFPEIKPRILPVINAPNTQSSCSIDPRPASAQKLRDTISLRIIPASGDPQMW